MGAMLSQSTGAEMDHMGRVIVEADLSIPGHPEILVLGDLACFLPQSGRPLPGTAPVAMHQARYAARLILPTLAGRTLPPFRYLHYGSMATIGRAAGVAEMGPIRLSGLTGWLAWLFVHLLYIVQFQNKILVLIQWAWNYFTRNRSSRLITNARDKR